MKLDGSNLIAGEDVKGSGEPLVSRDVLTGEPIGVEAHEASAETVAKAGREAGASMYDLRTRGRSERHRLLTHIASRLEKSREHLTHLFERETGLGARRADSELTRTVDQFEFMGDVALEGSYLDLAVDSEANCVRICRPLGPVGVFAAGNFPFAFGVGGTDTASALAAGCAVIAKAHPFQPATSEAVGRVLVAALSDSGFPPGSFSMIHGFDAGQRLVLTPEVKAIAFTGSYEGGSGIHELVANRNTPIPVYAEMGSTNPVVVMPSSLERRLSETLTGFLDSVTLGAGQFCTKPGLLFVPRSHLTRVIAFLTERLGELPEFPALHPAVGERYQDRLKVMSGLDAVDAVPSLSTGDSTSGLRPAIFYTSSDRFLTVPELRHETFGPSSVVVGYQSADDLARCLEVCDGHLAAAVHAEDEDRDALKAVVEALAQNVGRIVWNGWTTGVRVSWETQHGGPWPATSSPQHTSVGAAAVRRFVRPVEFQGVPEDLLPSEYQDRGTGMTRRVGGVLTSQRSHDG